MPFNGSGVYERPANTTAVSGQTISSSKYETLMVDFVDAFNTDTPVVAGGTGSSTASGARTNLGIPALAGESGYTGTHDYSSGTLQSAAPSAGADVVNKTYADANYVAAGGGWQYKTTATVSGSPETVAIDDTGTVYSGQTNVKLRFDLRHLEVGAASSIGSFGFQVSSDGGTTKVGGKHTSWPLPKDTDTSNNSSATLSSDSSSFVDFFDKSGTPGNNRNRGQVCGEIIIYQDTGIGNTAYAKWDLIFEDLLSGDAVRVSGGAEFAVSGAINWVRFVGNAYTTGTPTFVNGGKIDMYIQEAPA